MNEEATSLDWSKSRSHTLSGRKVSNHYEDDVDHLLEATDVGHKLGGGSNLFSTARLSSVAAAFDRYISSGTSSLSEFQARNESAQVDAVKDTFDNEDNDERFKYVGDNQTSSKTTMIDEDGGNYPNGYIGSSMSCLSDNGGDDSREDEIKNIDEPDSDKPLISRHMESLVMPKTNGSTIKQSQISDLIKMEPETDDYAVARLSNDVDFHSGIRSGEPDPDNEAEMISPELVSGVKQDLMSSFDMGLVKAESDLDVHMRDSDSIELQRIEQPVAAICARIQESIKLLRSELTPHTAASVLQTLSKIIRLSCHPSNMNLVLISIYFLSCLASCFS